MATRNTKAKKNAATIAETVFDLCPPQSEQPVMLKLDTIIEVAFQGLAITSEASWSMIRPWMESVREQLLQLDMAVVTVNALAFEPTVFTCSNPAYRDKTDRNNKTISIKHRFVELKKRPTRTPDDDRRTIRESFPHVAVRGRYLPIESEREVHVHRDAAAGGPYAVKLDDVSRREVVKQILAGGYNRAARGLAVFLPGAHHHALLEAFLFARGQSATTAWNNTSRYACEAVEREILPRESAAASALAVQLPVMEKNSKKAIEHRKS